MKVLCLGHSRIAQRRVLPGLEAAPSVQAIEVASRRGAPALDGAKFGRTYGDFRQALDQSDADLVYVSTANHEHETWTEASLDADKHVVVDKPACLTRGAAERLAARAQEKGRLLAEATVYAAHPQIARCREIFAGNGDAPTRLSACFCMPPLPDDNFRYRREQGGGVLYDLGPYAVSLGRVFFGAEPEEVHACVNRRGGPDQVETAYSVLLRYSGGRTVTGHFGFDTAYENSLTLLGPRTSVSLRRVFTTAPDQDATLRVVADGAERTETVPAADAFAAYFEGVAVAWQRGEGAALTADLLTDARALHALRRAAGESS